ncbi:hypothetical protein CONPUDRAFT_150216 [Coniophora puteana RWD-64-598 SS2]|uniref:Uncharacterized protein n=1 Tax=Coniophora puteana (strain RWD-64-598) TaxID=741705 RepID=A0A5M3N2Z9_CONPW|nr:uncharacterized protein CONPUDRAFT_150216 [Coniophora puteana RWD-64-598 SS2]EIW85404.1 hypothetical protein CONPUDRAFT_150216 [Coniophora puteana RWD-64-598 SS2]
MPPSEEQQQHKEAEAALNAFVDKDLNARYTFDGERGQPQSEICRESRNQRECIALQMYSTKMFEVMQKRGFYCALPMDPNRTHMVCTKIPDS